MCLARHVGSLFGASGNGCVTPRTLRAGLIVSQCVSRVTVVTSRHGFMSTLVIPMCNFIGSCTGRGNVRCGSVRRLLRRPGIMKLFHTHVSALRRRFTGCRRVGHFALLPRPFDVRGNRLAGALGLGHPIMTGGCGRVVSGVCRRWLTVVGERSRCRVGVQ